MTVRDSDIEPPGDTPGKSARIVRRGPSGASGSYTLLLVDDVRTTLAVEKSFLESRNLKVFATNTATEALTLAAKIRPDLIVLDYEMPEMKGDEVCRRLKASPRTAGIPVLILSAHADPSIAKTCEAAGAVGFLKKSEGRGALLDSVAAVLGLPQRRNVRVPCSITVGIHSEERILQGMVHNLSLSGLYLTVEATLRVRSLVRVVFTPPTASREIRALGEIVRAEALSGNLLGYGIEMIEADEESQAALREFVGSTI